MIIYDDSSVYLDRSSGKMISVCGLGGLDRDGDEGVKCHK